MKALVNTIICNIGLVKANTISVPYILWLNMYTQSCEVCGLHKKSFVNKDNIY